MAGENNGLGRRLSTWKEIAGYFGRDERTVKRWETSRNLPVRRIPNGPRSTVFAYENELADWLKSGATAETILLETDPATAESEGAIAPPRQPAWPKPHIMLAAVAGIAGLVAVAAYAAWIFAPAPRGSVGPEVRPAIHASNAEAESFYRSGLYEWQTRTPEGLGHAVDDFTQAIVRDPGFAPAYVGLADCYDVLREYTTMAPDDAYPRAIAAAKRAIALDPNNGGAHGALAFAEFYWLRDTAAAMHEFRRAVALSPRNAMTHHWFANVLAQAGNFRDALVEIGQAESLDTESSAIRADKALILYMAGRTNEAMTLIQRVEQSDPSFYSPHSYLAGMDFWRGDDAGYLAELATSAKLRRDEGGTAIAAAGSAGLANGGHIGMLQAMLDERKGLYAKGMSSAYSVAATYGELNDADDAIAWLRRSLARGEADNIGFGGDRAFAQLRASGRLRDILTPGTQPHS